MHIALTGLIPLFFDPSVFLLRLLLALRTFLVIATIAAGNNRGKLVGDPGDMTEQHHQLIVVSGLNDLGLPDLALKLQCFRMCTS